MCSMFIGHDCVAHWMQFRYAINTLRHVRIYIWLVDNMNIGLVNTHWMLAGRDPLLDDMFVGYTISVGNAARNAECSRNIIRLTEQFSRCEMQFPCILIICVSYCWSIKTLSYCIMECSIIWILIIMSTHSSYSKWCFA